jgi:hypothetical protein
MFDIVIPIGPYDKDKINKQIHYTKCNIVGYRNIYLICYDDTIAIDGCITISEKIFPFSIDTISEFHGKIDRNGWYLQQLLKLYAGKIIPGILERYLIIDCDTFFMTPTTFIHEGKCLYNFGTEYHIEYFEHMTRLDEDFVRMDENKSGICHHMMFETKYVDEIIDRIEEKHGDTFYNVFLKLVSEKDIHLAGASEYEIYFNYMLKFHPDKIIIRELMWENNKFLENTNVNYISCHHYL